jgi:flagellar basal-body rod protein FlgB
VEVLTRHFLKAFSTQFKGEAATLTADAMQKLLKYTWPGNVRELQNVIQRAVLMASGNTITAKEFALEQKKVDDDLEWVKHLPIGRKMQEVETQFILETLRTHNGNRTHSAKPQNPQEQDQRVQPRRSGSATTCFRKIAMSSLIGGMLTRGDQIKMAALDMRLERQNVLNGNIANAETPGYRALGYDFEEQLQALAGDDEESMPMKAADPRHFRSDLLEADGTLQAEVYVRPTESVGQDGNTVDVDKEMGDMAQNQILYKATVELINKKLATLKYAIANGGQV